MSEQPKCELCGEPMPAGEEMFNYHGFSGPCPKPPLPKRRPAWIDAAAAECADHVLVGQGSKTFAEIIERHFAASELPSQPEAQG
jgi:hypothetical protein